MSSTPHRHRQREQRAATRRGILAAAEGFLRQAPLRELSVEAVMAETGLTRTAFYRHFDDLTDLLLRLLSEVSGELAGVAERWSRRAYAEHPIAAHEALGEIVELFVRHGPLIRALSEATTTDERIERAYQASVESFIEVTRQVLDRELSGGSIDIPDTRAMATALNLVNQAYLLHEFGTVPPAGDPALARATLETIWLRTVGPGAGVTPPGA